VIAPHSESPSGKLIMAANALGNPNDIPTRSLEALRAADLIVFEEDKIARQTLKAASIHRDYLRLTEHLEQDTVDAVKKALKAGQTVVFMSDQGTPTLADPGKKLLEAAYVLGAQVVPIPGPSSVTAALSICPFLNGPFLYLGFPPREPAERDAWLAHYSDVDFPVVILDTPYRRPALIASCMKVLGADRRALMVFDISGPDEAVHLDKLENLARIEKDKINFVLIIAPSSALKRAAGDKMASFAGKAEKSARPQRKPPQSGQRGGPPKGRTSGQRKTPKRSPR
jgi:16S rRNA (cytidine1402-2'-O)-methyltransferase